MPWESFKLNDGNEAPGIGYGTGGSEKGRRGINSVKLPLSVGITYIDTSKGYGNEKEVGQAVKESGLPRKNIFILTKYSYTYEGDTDVDTSTRNSLKALDTYIDLYLIHRPSVAGPAGVPAVWKRFEDYQRKGTVKSIGVSNFTIEQLKTLFVTAKVKPAVNQIILHPYVYPSQVPIIDFCKANGIVIQAYSVLTPITELTGGPLDKPLARIAEGRRATTSQILLAWAKAKGVVVVTTSSNKERLQGYVDAGDIYLTDSEIAIIDAAGQEGAVEPPPDGRK